MTSIYDKARQGLTLDDVLVIDCHCHMGPWHNFNAPANSAEGMISSMNVTGIDMACVTAHSSIGPDYIYGNNIVIQAIEKYPQRFIGYSTVNPNYEDDIGKELQRCFKIPGMRGIKLHPDCHGAAIDDKRYHAAYEIADDVQCPVLIHVWGYEEVCAVERLAPKYKKVKFIMGHAGADIGGMQYAADVMDRYENVYADLALSRAYEKNIEWLVSLMGSKRILYGSDMPFFDPRPAFGKVAIAEISDEEKRDIFGLNMKKLLKL